MSPTQIKLLYHKLLEDDPLGDRFRRLNQYIASQWAYDNRVGTPLINKTEYLRFKLSVEDGEGTTMAYRYLKQNWGLEKGNEYHDMTISRNKGRSLVEHLQGALQESARKAIACLINEVWRRPPKEKGREG